MSVASPSVVPRPRQAIERMVHLGQRCDLHGRPGEPSLCGAIVAREVCATTALDCVVCAALASHGPHYCPECGCPMSVAGTKEER